MQTALDTIRHDSIAAKCLVDALQTILSTQLKGVLAYEIHSDDDGSIINLEVSLPKNVRRFGPPIVKTPVALPAPDDPENPTLDAVIDRFAAYHAQEPCWGSLHIVLDDGNVNDSDVEFCIAYAEELGDDEGAELGRILLKMSKNQRLKIGAEA